MSMKPHILAQMSHELNVMEQNVSRIKRGVAPTRLYYYHYDKGRWFCPPSTINTMRQDPLNAQRYIDIYEEKGFVLLNNNPDEIMRLFVETQQDIRKAHEQRDMASMPAKRGKRDARSHVEG